MGRRIRYRPSLAQEQIPSIGARGNSSSTSNTILVIVAASVLVFAVIVLGGYYLIQNRKFQSEFAPLLEVCRGKRADAASIYSSSRGTHPAIAVRNSGQLQLDTYLIPGETIAQTLAETQIVLCLGGVQEIFIESCPYGDEGGGHYSRSLERYYLKQEAKLIEAKTGRVVAVQSFTGSSPERCHKTEFFSGDNLIVKTVGTSVSDADVQKWAQTYLIVK